MLSHLYNSMWKVNFFLNSDLKHVFFVLSLADLNYTEFSEVCYHIYVMQSSKLSLKWKILFFCHFLLGYHLSFILVKTPWWLGNWFLRNSILSYCKNNKKQKNSSALFGYIFKLIFVSSLTHFAWLHHICTCNHNLARGNCTSI